MEAYGVRVEPEGCPETPSLQQQTNYNELESFNYTFQDFENTHFLDSNMTYSLRSTDSSTFTFITNLSEDLLSYDTMATRKCFSASSLKSLYEDSTLDLIIDRACDFVASANSSLTLSETTDDEDMQYVPASSVLTREVVGCEDPGFPLTSQLENSQSTICPMSCSTSTLCRNQTLSSNGSLKRSSKPLASSTMIENFSHLSVSSPTPCISSTMTEELNNLSKPCMFQSDLHSIYTWTIHDKSQDTVFNESYVHGHHFIPNIPKTTFSSSSASKTMLYDNKESVVKSNNSGVLVDSLSVNESSGCFFRDGHIDMKSIFDKDIPINPNSLPRTSTKVNLGHKEDFHQVPGSSDDSGEDIGQERQEPEIPLPKCSKVFKFPKTTTQLKKLFSFKRSKGKNSDKTTFKPSQPSIEQMSVDKQSQDVVQPRDKKAVIKKMKKFNASLHKLDSHSSHLQVLALL